jgi:hypothetical protein
VGGYGHFCWLVGAPSAGQNQLWTFPPGPVKNSFFILSQLGSNLVVDIKGGKGRSGAELQLYTKKSTAKPADIDDAKKPAQIIAPASPSQLLKHFAATPICVFTHLSYPIG